MLLFPPCSNHDRPQDNHVRRFLQRHGIPYHYLPTTSGDKSEQGILELIQSTDFVVLARYMQVKLWFILTIFFFFFSSQEYDAENVEKECRC
jgi:hypothetical protein